MTIDDEAIEMDNQYDMMVWWLLDNIDLDRNFQICAYVGLEIAEAYHMTRDEANSVSSNERTE